MQYAPPISAFFIQGFVIVFLLFIIIIISLISYIKKKNLDLDKSLTEKINTLNVELLDTIKKQNKQMMDSLSYMINSTPSNDDGKHHEELLNTFVKLKNIIKDDLYYTMNSTGACRVALYLFHNGTKSTNGKISFIKLSCIGEKTLIGSGIQEQIVNHSNIPVNIFDNMYEKLISNGKYLILNDEETMMSARRQFISAKKIHYSYAVTVYDTNNNLLGFILAEYDHTYNKIVSDREYDELARLSAKISPILSFSDYAEIALNNENIKN